MPTFSERLRCHMAWVSHDSQIVIKHSLHLGCYPQQRWVPALIGMQIVNPLKATASLSNFRNIYSPMVNRLWANCSQRRSAPICASMSKLPKKHKNTCRTTSCKLKVLALTKKLTSQYPLAPLLFKKENKDWAWNGIGLPNGNIYSSGDLSVCLCFLGHAVLISVCDFNPHSVLLFSKDSWMLSELFHNEKWAFTWSLFWKRPLGFLCVSWTEFIGRNGCCCCFIHSVLIVKCLCSHNLYSNNLRLYTSVTR